MCSRKQSSMISIFSILLIFCAAGYANDKDLAWKTGSLTDVHVDKGSRISGSATPANGSLAQLRYDTVYYQIETSDTIYVATQLLRRRKDTPLNVTVNGQVKFALKGTDFYLIDEGGKQNKLALEKKTLKTPLSGK